MSVVNLAGEDLEAPQVNPTTIELLEDLLERARAGNLTGFAGAFSTQQGASWCVVGSGCGFQLLGGLELAKMRVVQVINKGG